MTAPGDSFVITHRRYTEEIIPGRRLGRQIMTDSRSAAYPFRVARRVPVISVDHERHAPILDQDDVGACEGMTQVGCAATSPLFDQLPAGTVLDEALAIDIYSMATSLDGFPGTYTPMDTGTDSTSANKATQAKGLIGGYTHATSLDDVLQALMKGPVNLAFDWYESFDKPAPSGLMRIAKSAGIRGGHAVCARKVDAAKRWVWIDNSWTAKWGVDGRAALEYATLERLLAQDGECVVPAPLSAPPAPVPVPPEPSADPVLAAYLADPKLIDWASARHLGANAYAAGEYLKLRASH